MDVIQFLTDRQRRKLDGKGHKAFGSTLECCVTRARHTPSFTLIISPRLITTRYWQLITSTPCCHSLFCPMYIVLHTHSLCAFILGLSPHRCSSVPVCWRYHSSTPPFILSSPSLACFLPSLPFSLLDCVLPRHLSLIITSSAFTCSSPQKQ